MHLVLGDDGGVGGVAARLRLALDGQVLGEGLPGDDHRGRVDAVLATEAGQALGHLDHLAGVAVGLAQGPQLGRHLVALLVARRELEAGVEGSVTAHDQGGHGLGDAVAHRVGHAQHPGRVADRGPGLDGGEGDDLGHVVGPVALGRVADHLRPVALVEVHVDVGHLPAALVEEALEDESVLDGVEVDDAQAVGHAAAGGRAPPGTDPDALLAGVVDEVPDHEEVGGQAHAVDDAQLVVDPLHDVARHRGPVAAAGALEGEGAQVFAVGDARRQVEVGQLGLAELDLDVDPLGDGQGVVAGLGGLGEQRAHLGRRLQVVLVAVELEPLGVVDLGPGLHAQQGVVGDGVGLVGVVAVVSGQQG